MAKKEQYTLNKLEIRPEWSAKNGQNPLKQYGKISFNDETGKKAFEIHIDSVIAKKIIQVLVEEIGNARSGSIINAIKEKLIL